MHSDFGSFPSGHVANAATIAVAIGVIVPHRLGLDRRRGIHGAHGGRAAPTSARTGCPTRSAGSSSGRALRSVLWAVFATQLERERLAWIAASRSATPRGRRRTSRHRRGRESAPRPDRCARRREYGDYNVVDSPRTAEEAHTWRRRCTMSHGSRACRSRPCRTSSTTTRTSGPPPGNGSRRAIAELGYTPNLTARSLRSGRTGAIALAVPELGLSYFAELAASVIEAAEEAGVVVLVGADRRRPRPRARAPAQPAPEDDRRADLQPARHGPGRRRPARGAPTRLWCSASGSSTGPPTT